MKKVISDHLTSEQRAEIEALAAMTEDEIDTRDIPEQRDWSGARRGVFFRPVKQQITLRIDADLIDWFRRHPDGEAGYQTRINRALREYVARQAAAGVCVYQPGFPFPAERPVRREAAFCWSLRWLFPDAKPRPPAAACAARPMR